MGNICCSPPAHGVFRHKVREQGLADTVAVKRFHLPINTKFAALASSVLSLTTQWCQPPYYDGVNGFEQVLDLVEDACSGLLQHGRQQERLQIKQEY
jgi:protein-tyrosine-phosphatase